jgi:hypothetical protein
MNTGLGVVNDRMKTSHASFGDKILRLVPSRIPAGKLSWVSLGDMLGSGLGVGESM